jgi:hypothetical protein
MRSGMAFCQRCGRPAVTAQPQRSAAPYNPAQPQRGTAPYNPAPHYSAAPPMTAPPMTARPVGKRRGHGLVISAAAIVLAAAILITGFWKPGWFTSNSYKYEGPSYSGNSAAFSVTPMPELTISAEANALDRDREFVVTQAAEEDYMAVNEAMEEAGVLLVNLYHLDAGLQENESFPGVFNMDFDLATLDVPEELYDYMTVYLIGDDGSSTPLQSTVNGSTLHCASDKNCWVAVGAVLYWGGGAAVAAIGSVGGTSAVLDYQTKWAGLSGKTTMNVKVCNGLYKVTWAIEDNSDYKAKKEKIDAIYNKTKQSIVDAIKAADYNSGYAMAQGFNMMLAQSLASNQEYQKLLKELTDVQWLLENSTPMQVVWVVNALIRANDYLAGTRQFIPVTSTTDVILVYDWPQGDDALGYAINPVTGAPYLRINMSVFNVSTDDTVKDDMYLTVAHELFHIFQSNYVTIDWNSDTIFWEATALVLEEEARKAYKDDSTITTMPILTDSDNFETLSTSFGKMPSDDASECCKNGYTLSRFINYLRTKGGQQFDLKQLLEAYSDSRDFRAALQTVTGLNDESFGTMYRYFCRDNVKQFYDSYKRALEGKGVASTLIPAVQLSAGTPFAKVPVADKPLSAYIREFKVDTASIGGEYALLLLSDKTLKGKKDFFPITFTPGPQRVKGLFYPVTSSASSYLMEIHSYRESDGLDSFYTAYLLTPPANPAVTIEEEKRMVIELPPESAAAREGVIDGYLVTITSSDGVVTTKRVAYSRWSSPLTLSLKKLTKEVKDVSFSVTVQEYIKQGGKYCYGPKSRDAGNALSETVLDDQLIEAQAGSGEITASMLWSTADDLDLHIITPSGDEIYYNNPSAGGGTLDVDRQASADNIVASPIENIYFSAPVTGTYKVFIYNYCDRTEGGASDYLVRITVGGNSQTFNGTIDGTGSTANILEFRYAIAQPDD